MVGKQHILEGCPHPRAPHTAACPREEQERGLRSQGSLEAGAPLSPSQGSRLLKPPSRCNLCEAHTAPRAGQSAPRHSLAQGWLGCARGSGRESGGRFPSLTPRALSGAQRCDTRYRAVISVPRATRLMSWGLPSTVRPRQIPPWLQARMGGTLWAFQVHSPDPGKASGPQPAPLQAAVGGCGYRSLAQPLARDCDQPVSKSWAAAEHRVRCACGDGTRTGIRGHLPWAQGPHNDQIRKP